MRTSTTRGPGARKAPGHKLQGEAAGSPIAYDDASPYVDTVTGNAVNATCKVQYRGTRATDLGASSPEQTVAVGRCRR